MRKTGRTEQIGQTEVGPSLQERYDWLLIMMNWPWRSYLSGPDENTRTPKTAWMFSWSHQNQPTGVTYADGCIYAPTRDGVIVKAMRYWGVQRQAERMLADAAK